MSLFLEAEKKKLLWFGSKTDPEFLGVTLERRQRRFGPSARSLSYSECLSINALRHSKTSHSVFISRLAIQIYHASTLTYLTYCIGPTNFFRGCDTFFSFLIRRPVQAAEDHGASLGHPGREKRAGHSELQGGRKTRTDHRVVQGRRAGQDFPYRRQKSSRVVTGRGLVFPSGYAREERTRWRSLLVRCEESSRIGQKQERHASSCR